jgi:hypothetical protein
MQGINNLKFKWTALSGVRYSDVQMDFRMYVYLMKVEVNKWKKVHMKETFLKRPTHHC